MMTLLVRVAGTSTTTLPSLQSALSHTRHLREGGRQGRREGDRGGGREIGEE